VYSSFNFFSISPFCYVFSLNPTEGCQNFQNNHFFRKKKKKCNDLGVGKDLTDFAKIYSEGLSEVCPIKKCKNVEWNNLEKVIPHGQ
jgi:hypothetical protein